MVSTVATATTIAGMVVTAAKIMAVMVATIMVSTTITAEIIGPTMADTVVTTISINRTACTSAVAILASGSGSKSQPNLARASRPSHHYIDECVDFLFVRTTLAGPLTAGVSCKMHRGQSLTSSA